MRKKKPNLIDTDFKASVLAAEIIENEAINMVDVVVIPKGPQKRAYSKEIVGLEKNRSDVSDRELTNIGTNRDGLYDMLPEGLFHQPPASSLMITEEQMIKDIKNRRIEEKQTRQFFAPFEAELNQLRIMVELYENRLDKKNEYDELINIFLKEWSEFSCFTNKQMLILIHVLPVIHEQRNNLTFISSVINMLFKIPVTLQYKLIDSTSKATAAEKGGATSLGGGTLGVDFIAGETKDLEEKLMINIGPVSATQMMEFLPGTRTSTAMDVLLSYFLPLQTPVKINLIADPSSQQMIIGGEQANAVMGYTTYLGV